MGQVEGEQEGEEVYNDTDLYAYDLNEVQEDEEVVPLERAPSDLEVVAHTKCRLQWSTERDIPSALHYQ